MIGITDYDMTVVDAFQDHFELGCQWLQGPARKCELVWSIKQTGLASGGRKLDAVCPITCVNESTTAILGCRLLQRQRRTRACVFDSFPGAALAYSSATQAAFW